MAGAVSLSNTQHIPSFTSIVMLNLHLNLIFISFSLCFIIRQRSATIFEETSLEELDQLIEKQLAEEKADDFEFQFSRYRRTVKFRVCGQKLIDTLNQTCNGCTRPIPTNEVFEQNETSDDSFNFKRKRDVDEHHHEDSRRTKRQGNGLVAQCCLKECTLETFKTHCGLC